MVLDVMDENKWGDHEQFIADACEANPDIRWKLVFSHYSPYNSYEEYMEKGQEMRPYFLKFADDYDIDAVLCGHNHCYMRSYFINGDGTWQDYESPAVDPENILLHFLLYKYTLFPVKDRLPQRGLYNIRK